MKKWLLHQIISQKEDSRRYVPRRRLTRRIIRTLHQEHALEHHHLQTIFATGHWPNKMNNHTLDSITYQNLLISRIRYYEQHLKIDFMLLRQHTLSESRQLRDLPSSLELQKKIRFPVELKESNIRKGTINEKIILTEGKNSSFFLNSNNHTDLF